MKTLYFTSCNYIYLKRALVLSESLKKYNPNVEFRVLLSDDDIDINNKLFKNIDSFVYIKDLNINVKNYEYWKFYHNVTELCTAVKASAFKKFLNEGYDRVIYLDPDMCVYANIDKYLNKLLNNNEIILTPHRTKPDNNFVVDMELLLNRRGIFNLGFLAIKKGKESAKFLNFWEDRLLEYCYSDEGLGIFTDQKWCDFAPVYFNVKIMDPIESGINISAWNLSQISKITTKSNNLYADDNLIRVTHNSGGGKNQTYAIDCFGKNTENIELYDNIHNEYLENEKNYDNQLLKRISSYDYFNDFKTLIINQHRKLYKNNIEIQNKFTNPYDIKYHDWFIENYGISDPSQKLGIKFNHINYSNRYSDLNKAFGYNFADLLNHYIEHGYNEDRNPL